MRVKVGGVITHPQQYISDLTMSKAGNASLICLSDAQMLLATSKIEQSLNAYAMPFVILFGITGNIINLTVLLTPSLRNR